MIQVTQVLSVHVNQAADNALLSNGYDLVVPNKEGADGQPFSDLYHPLVLVGERGAPRNTRGSDIRPPAWPIH